MVGYDKYFGFELTQRQTLEKLLEENAAEAVANVPVATTAVNGTVKRSATKPTIATANATDLATAQALANDLKTQFNDLLVKLKAAGIMA